MTDLATRIIHNPRAAYEVALYLAWGSTTCLYAGASGRWPSRSAALMWAGAIAYFLRVYGT